MRAARPKPVLEQWYKPGIAVLGDLNKAILSCLWYPEIKEEALADEG